MRSRINPSGRFAVWAVSSGIFFAALVAVHVPAQTSPYERAFPQSKATVEKALTAVQSNLAGHLPVLDGFAKPGEHPLDRYQRAYYQSTVQVSSTPSGGSLVRVSTKAPAWYADPVPKFPDTDRTFSSSLSQGLAAQDRDRPASTQSAIKPDSALQAEADSLEEILKNQAHPKNLVAVKKSGTPVVSTPSLNAKPQFLASMHDEFEMLDFNADWVHVRISGLSRGWIWRNSVEMPDGIRDTDAHPTPALTPAADLFHVAREETAPFPGDWEPLRSQNVKIISVQKIDDNAKDAGPKARLEYAKFLLEKNYQELAQNPSALAGIVVIFDSADGGMIAATMATLQQWRAGTLSDSALWHKCFFDPPETFESSGSSASQ